MGIGEINLDGLGDSEASQTFAAPGRHPQRHADGFQFPNQGSSGVACRPCHQDRHPIGRLPFRACPGYFFYRSWGATHSAMVRSTNEQT